MEPTKNNVLVIIVCRMLITDRYFYRSGATSIVAKEFAASASQANVIRDLLLEWASQVSKGEFVYNRVYNSLLIAESLRRGFPVYELRDK